MLAIRHNHAKFLLIIGLLTSNWGFAAPIYKATLPDGRVIYTDDVDSAYKQVTNNSQITVLDNLDTKPTVTTSPAVIPSDIDKLVAMNISSTEASRAGDYQLTLISPQPDMAYHRPAQSINIQVRINPTLKPDDRISYKLDGQEIGDSEHNNSAHSNLTTFSIPTTDINPDKHTLTATIINNLDKPIATVSTDFYVILTNPLIKQQKEIIAKRAEYDALPWYRKVTAHVKGEPTPIDPKKIDMNHLELGTIKSSK